MTPRPSNLLLRWSLFAWLALAGPAWADAATALWVQYESNPASIYEWPASTPQVVASPAHVSVTAGPYRLELAPPSGTATLAPGVYEGAARYPFNGNAPGIDLTNGSFGCNAETGRFVVHEAAFDGNQLIRLSVDFEQHCEGVASATYGELRVNSAVPITANRAAGWTTPDPFTFRPRTFVSPGAEVLSATTTIYGINAPAPISIDNGTYSVNGGPFTASPGLVSNRDHVRVLLTAPGTPNASATANLSVGGVAGSFVVSTYSTGTPVSGIFLQGTPGDYIYGGTLLALPPDWSISAAGSSTRFSWHMTGGTDWWDLLLSTGAYGSFAVGSYEEAARTPFAGNAPGVEFTGSGRGCNTITGRFAVLEATYDANGALASFAADFEQHCEGGPYPLYGEVRWNSAVPFSFEKPAGSTQPDPFTFKARNEVPQGAVVASNAVSIYGINAPAPIHVTNGEYRIDGGAWTSVDGIISNKSRVQVRTTAPATPGGSIAAVLDVGGQTGTFSVRAYAPGDVTSALYYKSSSGDYIGLGATVLGLPPEWSLQPNVYSQGYVSFAINGAGGAWYYLDIAAPPNMALAQGNYENAARAAFRGASPGIDFDGNGRGCNTIAGRFTILDIAWDGATLSRFAANFEQRCEVTGPPLYGEIRYNSAIPLTMFKAPGSITPDPFGFAPRLHVPAGALVESDYTAVTGINAPSPVQVAGGEYSIDGGAWTSATGSISNYSRIRVRLTASSIAGQTASATLTVGGVSATFSATTFSTGDPRTLVHFRSTPGDYIGGGVERTFETPASLVNAGRNYDNGVTFNIVAGDGNYWTLDMAAPGYQPLQPGPYTNATRFPFQLTAPGLDFSGAGRGCNTLAGRFIVLEAVYNPDGSVSRFAADFEQHCEGAAAALVGEVRYNSTVPLDQALRDRAAAARRDLSGEGRADLLWSGPSSMIGAWLMNGLGAEAYGVVVGAGQGAQVAAIADLDGDGRKDLVVRYADGHVDALLMSGLAPSQAVTLLGGGSPWRPTGTGDFNGDGKPDLVWADGLGNYGIWLMNGTSAAAYAALPGVVGTFIGDFDGDGRSDFLGVANGMIRMWTMNGATVTNSADVYSAAAGWSVALLGDFNGDGRTDILLRHTLGNYKLLIMNGVTIQEQVDVLGPGTGWHAVLAADLDGDGRSDIVWAHDNGAVGAWLMYGTSLTAAQLVGPGTGWSVVAADDFDGDGKADLVWRHANGSYGLWLMDGLTAKGYAGILGAGSGWEVVR